MKNSLITLTTLIILSLACNLGAPAAGRALCRVHARNLDCDVLAPLEDLRHGELVLGDGPFLVVCEKGPRSSEAARFLQSRGAKAEYLGGGLRWRSSMG